MKARCPNIIVIVKCAALTFAMSGIGIPPATLAVGTWVPVDQQAEGSIELMEQLSDGTVLGANNPDSPSTGIGNGFYELDLVNPSTHHQVSNYSQGTWESTPVNQMHHSRLFYATDMLPDGRVFVAGGEYGDGPASAEIFDPVHFTWTEVDPPVYLLDPNAGQGFLDAESEVIDASGDVLIAPVNAATNNGTLVFNPGSSTWRAGPPSIGSQKEATWLKLPDGSILTVDADSTSSERYIPSLDMWVPDAGLPVDLWHHFNHYVGQGYYVGETGPAFLCADGRAFFLGGSGHTAFYTPSGSGGNGTWIQGPDIPQGLVAADSSGAMMVNGKILVAVGVPPTQVTNNPPDLPGPTYFFEFDPAANGGNGQFTQVGSPTGGLTDDNCAPYETAMLSAADGTILYCHVEQGNLTYQAYGSQVYAYYPDGSPLPSGRPTIMSVKQNADGSTQLAGTLFNGISEGASFGDDAQMHGNYPLLRVTDSLGVSFFVRTYNWSSVGVQTGSAIVTTESDLGLDVGPGEQLALQIVANGIASDSWTYNSPVWVDFTDFATANIGTFADPFLTLGEGASSVNSGGTVIIKRGTSPETLRIGKPMTIMAINGPATIGR
jgi:hypothetical protein